MSKDNKSQKNKKLFFLVLIVLFTIVLTLVSMQQSNGNVNQTSSKEVIDSTKNNNNNIDKSDGLTLDEIIQEGRKKIENTDIPFEKPSFWDMIKIWMGLSNKADELSKNIEEKTNNLEFPKGTFDNKPFDRKNNKFTHFFENNKIIIILIISIFLFYLLWSIIAHEKTRIPKIVKQTFLNKKLSRKNNIHDDEEGLL